MTSVTDNEFLPPKSLAVTANEFRRHKSVAVAGNEIAPADSTAAAVKHILERSPVGTQEEMRAALADLGHSLTQSTVSRLLRKLGVVRAHEGGRSVYRLPKVDAPPPFNASMSDLVIGIAMNSDQVVVHTKPGSASLIARHIDHYGSELIMGTIAGDDTIFVAPRDTKGTLKVAQFLHSLL